MLLEVSCFFKQYLNVEPSLHAQRQFIGFTQTKPMADKVLVEFTRLHPAAAEPYRGSAKAAGFDLHCIKDAVVPKGSTVMLRTGLAMAIPDGYEGQIRCRSGLGKKGMMMPNGIGTIDSDYRGEILVLATFIGTGEGLQISAGERIAQMLIKRVPEVEFSEVSSLDELGSTDRGAGGFGSTGSN